jgi:hypothetical protein
MRMPITIDAEAMAASSTTTDAKCGEKRVTVRARQ